MNPSDLISFIPEKYRGWALFTVAVAPWIGRGYHALRNGGGLRGLICGLFFGTNTPKQSNDGNGKAS